MAINKPNRSHLPDDLLEELKEIFREADRIVEPILQEAQKNWSDEALRAMEDQLEDWDYQLGGSESIGDDSNRTVVKLADADPPGIARAIELGALRWPASRDFHQNSILQVREMLEAVEWAAVDEAEAAGAISQEAGSFAVSVSDRERWRFAVFSGGDGVFVTVHLDGKVATGRLQVFVADQAIPIAGREAIEGARFALSAPVLRAIAEQGGRLVFIQARVQ